MVADYGTQAGRLQEEGGTQQGLLIKNNKVGV